MKNKIFFAAIFLFILISCSKQQKTTVVADEKKSNDWVSEIEDKLENRNRNITYFSESEYPENDLPENNHIVYKYVNTSDGIKIRKAPNGEKIGSLKTGARVEIINETGIYDRIDGCYAQWIMVRTDDNREGYVFGYYLSDSLEEADNFRKTEYREACFKKAAEWISKIEADLKNQGWNLAFYPEGDYNAMWTYNYSEGVTLVFLPRYDEETGRHADFLYQVICTKNSEALKNIFPFKIGDPFPDVIKVFGEPFRNSPDLPYRSREGYYNHAYDLNLLTVNCDDVYNIPEEYYTDGIVETIILTETGF